MTDQRESEAGEQAQGAQGVTGDEQDQAKPDPCEADPNNPCIFRAADAKYNPCPWGEKPQDSEFRTLKINQAKAEARKPAEAEELSALDPATATARAELVETYRKVAHRKGGGKLWDDYVEADTLFRQIASELHPKDSKPPTQLTRWIKKWLAPGTRLYNLFDEHRLLEQAMTLRSGARECQHLRAVERTTQLAKANGEWKQPGDNIRKILATYAEALPALRCEIHNDDPYAIYRFWFEIAPKHLRLRDPDAIEKPTGLKTICLALRAFPKRRHALASAGELQDGGLFLVDPDGLEAHRKKVRNWWKAAAEAQAAAAVDLAAEPDDLAALKKRLDEQIAAEAKAKDFFQGGPA